MLNTAPIQRSTLFVYGTLMRKTGHEMARRLQNQSAYVGHGWINAKLYSLGRYPGAVLSEAAPYQVHGEVVRLTNPAQSLRWMDAYEGCSSDDPEPHEYERVVVPVTLLSGDTLSAWVYIYIAAISNARHVADGRFHSL